MAPSPLDMQTAGYDSPHNWMMSLAMDLAALCTVLCDCMLFLTACSVDIFSLSLCGFPPPPLPTPIVALVVVASKNYLYLKWWAIQLTIHSTVGV